MTGRGRPKSGRDVKGVSLKVNPQAWKRFQVLAEKLGLTRSQLVEKIAMDQIPLSPENSQTFESLGGVITQLVDETEKQLAYHNEQIRTLEHRLKELKQLSNNIQNSKDSK